MKKNRYWSVLLLSMLLSMTGTKSFAHDISVGIFEAMSIEFEWTNNNELAVTAADGNDVVIPESVFYEGKTYPVTGISDDAFYNCFTLTSITIPNSVTSIGNSAFYGCSSLTSITIPNSVTTIGYNAFKNCSALTSVTISNSMTTIGNSVFYGCSGLTSVTIPNSVTSISNSAFCSCSNLTSIDIPNSVTSIGSGAFDGTAWYNNQPDGLIYMGNVVYRYKGTMPENTSIEIKEGTVSVSPNAFSGCTGLTSITIPNSVTNIGANAFYNTTWYNNQPDGLVYLGLVAYKYKGKMSDNTNIDIKEGTVSISPYAFNECSGQIISITIPNSMTTISNSAFADFYGLTSITIPNTVTSIGDEAFFQCI